MRQIQPLHARLRWAACCGFALFCGQISAFAQGSDTIWRCGHEYSRSPCPQGKAIAPAAPINESDRQSADAATQRLSTQAHAMQAARTQREAEAARRGPGVIEYRSSWPAATQTDDNASVLSKSKRPKSRKGRKPGAEHFQAKGPATGKKKR